MWVTESFTGPLRDLSESLFQLEDDRSDDWQRMRPRLTEHLTEIGHDILCDTSGLNV